MFKSNLNQLLSQGYGSVNSWAIFIFKYALQLENGHQKATFNIL